MSIKMKCSHEIDQLLLNVISTHKLNTIISHSGHCNYKYSTLFGWSKQVFYAVANGVGAWLQQRQGIPVFYITSVYFVSEPWMSKHFLILLFKLLFNSVWKKKQFASGIFWAQWKFLIIEIHFRVEIGRKSYIYIVARKQFVFTSYVCLSNANSKAIFEEWTMECIFIV